MLSSIRSLSLLGLLVLLSTSSHANAEHDGDSTSTLAPLMPGPSFTPFSIIPPPPTLASGFATSLGTPALPPTLVPTKSSEGDTTSNIPDLSASQATATGNEESALSAAPTSSATGGSSSSVPSSSSSATASAAGSTHSSVASLDKPYHLAAVVGICALLFGA